MTTSADGARLLRACRAIVGLQHQLGDLPEDIFGPIRAVESELDEVPDERDAARWEADAFDRKMRERDEYIETVRPTLLYCFRQIRSILESSSGGAAQ